MNVRVLKFDIAQMNGWLKIDVMALMCSSRKSADSKSADSKSAGGQ
jgi:hypothetical protein